MGARLGNKLNLQGLSHESSHASADVAQVEAASTAAGSPLAPILRSKGILYMDVNPEIAFYWSHAGKSVSFTAFGPWPDNAPLAEGHFARRTELVFIGAGHNEASIRDLLDSCLLTEQETERELNWFLAN